MNYFPVWDQCPFLDNDCDNEKRLTKVTSQMTSVGNCIRSLSLTFSDVTNELFENRKGVWPR